MIFTKSQMSNLNLKLILFNPILVTLCLGGWSKKRKPSKDIGTAAIQVTGFII